MGLGRVMGYKELFYMLLAVVALMWALFDIAAEVGKLRVMLAERLDNIAKSNWSIQRELEELRKERNVK